jgi:hypothetical protein
MSRHEIIRSLKTIIISLLIGLGAIYVSAQTAGWTPAPANPPSNNTSPPINVSSSAQFKAGRLSLATNTLPVAGAALDVNGVIASLGLLVNGGIIIADGSQGSGKVLTSDANGLARWQGPSCSTATQRFNLNADINTPNNSGNDLAIMILPAATYTISGSGTFTNTGGGGEAAIYVTQGGVRPPSPASGSGQLLNGVDPGPLENGTARITNAFPWPLYIERIGGSSGSWSLPPITFTLSSGETLRKTVGQANMAGNLILIQSTQTCTGGSSGASNFTTSDIRAALEYKTCTAGLTGTPTISCTASCTGVKKVVGGGCSRSSSVMVTSNNNINVTDMPVANGSGWFCQVSSSYGGDALSGYAICL